MQSSGAYRPSLPITSSLTPWNQAPSRAHTGLSGTTDALQANFGTGPSAAAATTAAMLVKTVHFQSILWSEAVTLLYGLHGTSYITNRFRPCGSVFGWAGTGNAISPLAYTEAGIGRRYFVAASGTVSSGPPIVQQVGLQEPEQVDDAGLPIWEKIEAITARVPEEAWKSVPPDLASNVDRYLYRKDDGR